MVTYGMPIYLMHPLLLKITENMNGYWSILRAIILYVVCMVTAKILCMNNMTKKLFVTGKGKEVKL